jgi:hypothetical protein
MNMGDKIARAMVGESSAVLVGGTPAIAAWVPSQEWTPHRRRGTRKAGEGSVGKIKVHRQTPRSPCKIKDLETGKAFFYRLTAYQRRVFNRLSTGTTR